jgi:hypothetical protein
MNGDRDDWFTGTGNGKHWKWHWNLRKEPRRKGEAGGANGRGIGRLRDLALDFTKLHVDRSPP